MANRILSILQYLLEQQGRKTGRRFSFLIYCLGGIPNIQKPPPTPMFKATLKLVSNSDMLTKPLDPGIAIVNFIALITG